MLLLLIGHSALAVLRNN